jgi:hypothetical protein
MPSLYLDCVGGVAGDMVLASLIDAGASLDTVRSGLPIAGLDLHIERVDRQGLAALALTVVIADDHAHRNWRDVRALIDSGSMPERARARAHAAFARLAEAEGRVHGVSPEEVTFHEVGALDAIADICGVVLALEDLGIDDVVCSRVGARRAWIVAVAGTCDRGTASRGNGLRGRCSRGNRDPDRGGSGGLTGFQFWAGAADDVGGSGFRCRDLGSGSRAQRCPFADRGAR